MDLGTITVSDFKSQFSRDFPFLPLYVSGTYNEGDITYYTGLFYKSIVDGNTAIPTDTFKWQKFKQDADNYIVDSDITRAFGEAMAVFNQGLFPDNATITLAYLYCAAHFLAMDLRTARAGVASAGENPVTGRSVGNVSEQYSIPQQFLDDAILGYYASSGYGRKYLIMLMPALRGNFVSVAGATHA